MKRRISTVLLDRMKALASSRKDEEICGILVGAGGEIEDFVQLPNRASDPRSTFEFDMPAYFHARRCVRTRGLEIVGSFHSHPSGLCFPSAADAAAGGDDGQYWLILADGNASLWTRRTGGRWLGAFERVELEAIGTAALQPEPAAANRAGA